MFNILICEEIAKGKADEDNANQKHQAFCKEYGISIGTVWWVEGRKTCQMLIQFVFESRAAFEAAFAKLKLKKLQQPTYTSTVEPYEPFA